MYKIIIDANVLISSIFGGWPLQAVINAYNHIVLYSDKSELELKLISQKLINKLSIEQMISFNKLIKELLAKGKFIKIKKNKINICRDIKDNHFLDLAEKANADIIITGDKDLLCLSRQALKSVKLSNLKILTPKQFCILIEKSCL